MFRFSVRGIFLFITGAFILVAPRWLSDEPLWKRAVIFLLGVALLVFATWQSKQPSRTATQGSGVIRGYWVARAGIPGIAFLLVPFDMTDEPLWRRGGAFLLGVTLLAAGGVVRLYRKAETKDGVVNGYVSLLDQEWTLPIGGL